MRPRNISQVLFSLVCLHLLVFSLIKCQESQTLEETKSLDIMDVSSSQPQEFHIIPGVTRRLSIKLQREGQEITLDFRPSVADVAMFDIQVFSNEKIESSHSITFNEPETLLLHVDELNGECIITGDKDFYMRVEIPKASYTVQISHERNLKNLTQNQNPNVHKDIGNSYLVIGICTAAGAGAIILLALKRFIAKRKKGDSFSLDKNVKNSEDWKRMISDRNYTEVDLDKAEHELKAETEREREVAACGFNHVKPQIPKVPIKVPTVKTPGLSKKSPGLRDEKILRHKLAVDPRSKKSFLQKNSSKAKTQQNIEAKSDPEGVPIKEYKLSLQVYLDEEKEDRRNPTHKQIKALIRKMEEEGTLAQDCDPSAESDNEDQYEAPVLPNYFCCMLCFEGKRSAMVNPCRHIFSCKNCIDGLMDSYKICVLCSNEITGYEDLQN